MSEVKRYELVEMGKTYHKSAEMLLAEDGLWVDCEDYAELKAQRDALAAENAALKSYIDDECYIANPVGMYYIGAYSSSVETPATAAYLNSVRAEGVESFAHHQRAIADSETDPTIQRGHRITACRAEDFAAQLRAGKDGE